MKNINRLFLTVVVAFLCSSTLFISMPASASPPVPRISSSTNAVTLTEGTQQVVQVSLDEPIICEDPHALCDVTENITSSDPSRVTVDQSSINWVPAGWENPQTFTITVLNDGISNPSNTVTVSFSPAVSNSEYYSNFHPASIVLTIMILDQQQLLFLHPLQVSVWNRQH